MHFVASDMQQLHRPRKRRRFRTVVELVPDNAKGKQALERSQPPEAGFEVIEDDELESSKRIERLR